MKNLFEIIGWGCAEVGGARGQAPVAVQPPLCGGGAALAPPVSAGRGVCTCLGGEGFLYLHGELFTCV